MEGPFQVRRGFTLLELILAVTLLGVMTAVTFGTFRAVTNGWRVSRDYLDRLERADYALDQLVSGLKCAYYPHAGEQNYDYGFQLADGGDGDSPRQSDMIEWTKKGSAMVGNSSAGDAVHRIQVMVLEEGDSKWGDKIERTGLYARVKPLSPVIPASNGYDADEFTFGNEELYRPVLIAAGVDGFNCRVMAKAPEGGSEKKQDKDDFEDEFSTSNQLPYKVQMTFFMDKEDPEYASRRTRIPLIRVVRIPSYEQSLDGATLPEGEGKGDGKKPKGGGK